LVFIDETGTTTNMTRLRGRTARGKRLVDKTPHGHWKLSTFIAALRHDQITAPMVIDRPMNGVIFLAYVMTFLVPTLSKGDIVVMDNLSVHKVDGVAEAIEAAGARVLYLPPYSPDLNPIEQVFAKLKALLRKAKERTIDDLWDRIGKLLDEFSAPECANYLAHSGYAAT
jgi:transposase